jgi:hypothetical protein
MVDKTILHDKILEKPGGGGTGEAFSQELLGNPVPETLNPKTSPSYKDSFFKVWKAVLFRGLFITFLVSASFYSCDDPEKKGFEAVVEVEETVYRYEPADNGANPMWCHGNTCIIRFEDNVFASGLETIENAKPLNNTRWTLFRRDSNGWELLLRDLRDRTREPCPMGLYSDGRLFLSVNPTRTPIDTYNGPAGPQILQFSAQNPTEPYSTLNPVWSENPEFTEHSYRSFSIDGSKKEMILFQNIGDSHVAWTFFDEEENWNKQGILPWPWGEDYSDPKPIRICYPAVQLKNRAVYFLGVSDIVEPNKVWRDFKFNLTGRKWDYDFRRLFFTWSSDITTGKFNNWVEIASREKTAGHIFPCDLWLAPDGLVHILWTEKVLDERIREEFFKEEKQTYALNYGVIRNGEVIVRKPVIFSEEGEEQLVPGRGRFHVTADNRLFVFYHVYGKSEGENFLNENRLIEIRNNYSLGPPQKVNLQRPLSSFFTASIRGGTAPSDIIDLLGDDGKNTMRYVRIRLMK